MFCWETLSPGIYVDATLTHTTYLNIAADQILPIITLNSLMVVALFTRKMHPATLQLFMNVLKSMTKILTCSPYSMNLNSNKNLLNVLHPATYRIERIRSAKVLVALLVWLIGVHADTQMIGRK